MRVRMQCPHCSGVLLVDVEQPAPAPAPRAERDELRAPRARRGRPLHVDDFPAGFFPRRAQNEQ